MIAWALVNITELLAAVGGLIALLAGLRWKWRADGARSAAEKLSKKDADHAEAIRDRVVADRSRPDERLRRYDGAGYRD